MGVSVKIDSVVDREILRSPILTLPPRIDAAWFQNWIPISNRQIRLFHEKWGPRVETVTGFAWPVERPEVDEVFDLLPEATRYPYFLRLFLREIEPANERKRPLVKRLFTRYVEACRSIGVKPAASSNQEATRQQLADLAVKGRGEIATAVVILEWSALASPDKPLSMYNVAEALPDLREYILTLMSCSSSEFAHLSVSFSQESKSGDDAFSREMEPSVSQGEATTQPDENTIELVEDDPSRVMNAWASDLEAISNLASSAKAAEPDSDLVEKLRSLIGSLESHVSHYSQFRGQGPTEEFTARMQVALQEVRSVLVELELLADDLALLVERVFDAAALIPIKAPLENVLEAERLFETAQLAAQHVRETYAQYQAPSTLPPKQYLLHAQSLLETIEHSARLAFERCEDVVVLLRLGGVVGQDHSDRPGEVKNSSIESNALADRSEFPDGATFLHEDDNPFEIPSPEIAEALEEAAIDPFVADIKSKASDLFAHHEWGLGYHFARACEKIMPAADIAFSADELKIIALGKEMIGSKYEPEGFKDSLEACAIIASEIAASETSRDKARQIALYAAVIPTALFNVSESTNAFVIIDLLQANSNCADFFRIREVLEENRKSNFPLTFQNIAAAGDAKADRSYLEERRQRILEKIKAFQSSNFRFALGQKVKKELFSSQGELNILMMAMQTPRASAGAARFAAEFGDRARIMQSLERLAETVGHGQVIDGAARERLVAFLSDLASMCQDFTDATRQADEFQATAGRKVLVRRLIDGLVAGIDHFTAHLPKDENDPLIRSANQYASDVLSSLASVLRGSQTPDFDRSAVNLALHVPLFWLPKMTWSHAWLPSPADSPKLIKAITDCDLPRLRHAKDMEFRHTVEQRCQEDAFLAANALLQFWKYFDVSEPEFEALEARVATAESVRRGQLNTRYESVAALLQKVRRMALGSLKGATDLEESLRSVITNKPVDELAWDFMPEEVEGARVTDVNAAFARLIDLEEQARKLLDEGKAALANRIAELFASGDINDGERQTLQKLLESDDLATLSDWVAMFAPGETRRPILEAGVANKDLARFRSILGSIKGADLVQLGQSLAAGTDDGVFGISRLGYEQRDEANEILKSWQHLKRQMKSGLGSPQLSANLLALLSQIAYDCQLVEINKTKSDDRQLLVIDATMNLPFDVSSLILPDFGSMTSGSWQIAAAHNSVSISDLLALSEGAENRGTLVLYFGSLSADRRDSLKLECLRRRRKLLVVDEILLVTVLTMPEQRRLAMFEIAQASTVAKPYQDYGRSQVPPEMFKGRAKELASIMDPFGSYIVYGGRRLGKTALLRHLARRAPPNAQFGYIDLADSSSKSLWEKASTVLGGIFAGKAVFTPEAFEQGIKDYLQADGRRRVLLMLDEADNFVRQEAKEAQHHHVLRLISLMNDTNHRFKFILSGLHNVSRITKAENSPLAQISNDPVRIGPLVNGDAGDAEALVRVPLAALGYEFANREDVWRILSFANYYPILLQVFCQGLLDIIEDHQKSTGKLVWNITPAMVDRALKDQRIRAQLYESFEKTIKHIEQRYELLTYIIAERALIDVGEGIDGDGMTTSEVAERAIKYWPEAFPKGSDPAEIDYLLDEMEGFGILRRIPAGKWGLRSRMLLDLMVTDEEDLLARIYSFHGRTPEDHFDPKNARSRLTVGGRSDSEARISPLTDGQEAAILDAKIDPSATFVIFGPQVANVEHVYLALKRTNNPRLVVEARGWRDRADLISDIKRARQDDQVLVLIISHLTDWKPDWVRDAAKQPNVIRGRVRLVFVGGARHAETWSQAFPYGMKLPPRVQVETLKPWSRSYIAAKLDTINSLKPQTIDRILEVTGGWNDLCQMLFASASSSTMVSKSLQDLSASLTLEDVVTRFGVPAEYIKTFQTVAELDGETPEMVLSLLDDQSAASSVVRFGLLMGILTITAADPNSGSAQIISMNSIAKVMLTSKR
ncbi:ATP-binding protein (plasmid) [Agrobacterium leguminum]|uniref:ORC1/DEAH AAA+ ATPase domain-containing protein n=1 Tax=Agrobacterium deltaense NCPPB 1641 TaxID=1183425 RepID=A0A1S7U783_9HYPH|nr:MULTISPECIES: ATP-binding protein [Agrobacterium]WFS69839.1 ATP-binding protein [Agrobacterium leguminum]CVI62713.1 hypothetical protein AGR7A_pAt10059 [Agrobacterium deltaense NCPPB 1641]